MMVNWLTERLLIMRNFYSLANNGVVELEIGPKGDT